MRSDLNLLAARLLLQVARGEITPAEAQVKLYTTYPEPAKPCRFRGEVCVEHGQCDCNNP